MAGTGSTSTCKAIMKLSSSASETTGLFDGVLARGEVPPAVADPAWLQAMLQVEAALAEVQAFSGVIPSEAADEIAAAAKPERFDLAELGARAAESGNPVVPLVERLRASVSAATAPSVHLG